MADVALTVLMIDCNLTGAGVPIWNLETGQKLTLGRRVEILLAMAAASQKEQVKT